MAISYDSLWKILIDKHMTKADLRKKTGLSPNTMTKLNKGEPVAMSVIERICMTLNIDISDVIGFVEDCEK